MPVRTRLGVHEETIHQPKAQRESVRVWRDVLSRTPGLLSGRARAKDGQTWVAVCMSAIARLREVPENLVVAAILFYDIDDVVDRRRAGKQLNVRRAEQTLIAQHLIRIDGEGAVVWLGDHREIASEQ